MNREIKFRGKHIHAFLEPHNTGIWVYGYLCNDHYINSEELMGEMLVDKDSVGQYTGLEDKNGVEIYEGDIVYIIPEDEQGIVQWDEEMACFIVVFDNIITDFRDEWKGKDLEVVGNIYDDRH